MELLVPVGRGGERALDGRGCEEQRANSGLHDVGRFDKPGLFSLGYLWILVDAFLSRLEDGCGLLLVPVSAGSAVGEESGRCQTNVLGNGT